MKKIPKRLLDALIYLKRLYWKDGERELLPGIHALAMEIEDECNLEWLAISDFVSSILMCKGLSPNADNETIYEALKFFGWEVSDEVEESESL